MGQRLRAVRDELRWSQEKLAGYAGITKKAISKIERGETKEPSARNLGRIAEALNVSVNWLMYGEKKNGRKTNPMGATMSMLDCEILAQLEELTEAQKREILRELREQAKENREVLEAYKARQEED